LKSTNGLSKVNRKESYKTNFFSSFGNIIIPYVLIVNDIASSPVILINKLLKHEPTVPQMGARKPFHADTFETG
jgi:hypothetical protein